MVLVGDPSLGMKYDGSVHPGNSATNEAVARAPHMKAMKTTMSIGTYGKLTWQCNKPTIQTSVDPIKTSIDAIQTSIYRVFPSIYPLVN